MKFLWQEFDPNNPIDRAYYRYYLVLVRCVVALVVIAVALALMGVPHLQTTYRYVGSHDSNGQISSHRKVSANYIGPFGWHQVHAYQYSEAGCPVVIWIPLTDCF